MSEYPTLYEMLKRTAERMPNKKLFESITTTSKKNEDKRKDEFPIRVVESPFHRLVKRIKKTIKDKFPWPKKEKVGTKITQELTFEEAKNKADRLASFLWSHGVKSEDWKDDARNVDRVVVFAEPSAEFIQALTGINKIGAIAVILKPDLKEGLRESLEKTQPKIALAKEGSLNHEQREIISDLDIPLMDFDIPDLNKKVKINRNPYCPAVILKTSGTMGKPTLPTLNSVNLSSNVSNALKYIPIDERDTFLSIGRWFHIFPLMSTLLVPLATGAKVSYTPSAGKLGKIARTVKPTLFFGVPKLYDMLYKKEVLTNPIGKFIAEPPLPQFMTRALQNALGWIIGRQILKSFGGNLRFFFSGSSSLNIKIAKFLRRAKVLLLEGYGASETSPVMTAPRLKGNEKPQTLFQKIIHEFSPIPYCPDPQKVGSVGEMLPVHSYDFRSAEEGASKALVVKGDSVFIGNWTRDGLDRSDFDEDGYYHTGDILEVDSDGDFFFKGREDRMIVLASGKNVHPEQLEKKLSHIKTIDYLMVGEVRAEGETKDIWALVFPNREYIRKELKISPKDTKAIREFIRSRIKEESKNLPSYLKLRKIEISEKEAITTDTKNLKLHKYQSQK